MAAEEAQRRRRRQREERSTHRCEPASAASAQDVGRGDCREYTSTRRVTGGFLGLSPLKTGLPNSPSVFFSVSNWAGNLLSKTCQYSSAERGLSNLSVT